MAGPCPVMAHHLQFIIFPVPYRGQNHSQQPIAKIIFGNCYLLPQLLLPSYQIIAKG